VELAAVALVSKVIEFEIKKKPLRDQRLFCFLISSSPLEGVKGRTVILLFQNSVRQPL
jgi:hypothetical protein